MFIKNHFNSLPVWLGSFGLLLNTQFIHAESAGLTLRETAGARPAALAEAFSTVPDDVTALSYNPGTLPTLNHPQASFFFRQGFEEQSYGQLNFGVPSNKNAYGVSVGYFNGGDVEIFNGNGSEIMEGQRDLIVSLVSGRRLGALSVGITGKYISSQLINSIKATAYAGDIGAHYYMGQRVQFGGAIQNIGTKLKFGETGEDLPRIARLGAGYSFVPGLFATSMFLEGAYQMNENELNPSVGIESRIGPLTLRGGYKHDLSAKEFSIGTGVSLNRMTIDYSLAMLEDIDVQHQFSLTQRFGGQSVNLFSYFMSPKEDHIPKPKPLAKSKNNPKRFVVPSYQSTFDKGRIYEVKEGDTWESISFKFYGLEELSIRLERVNQHLVGNKLSAGTKIIIPE